VQRSAGGRATRATTIHLTLAFLGDVEDGQVDSLRKLTVRGLRHALPIEQARYWPHNRIIWVGPQRIPDPLADLAAVLDERLRAAAFRTESRQFAAHVTLVRKARAPSELPPLPALRWPIEEFVLARSRLSAAGPDYEVLQRYALT
jgi:2'-5' RNA ligase